MRETNFLDEGNFVLSHRAFTRFEALSLTEAPPYACTKPESELPPEDEPEAEDESKQETTQPEGPLVKKVNRNKVVVNVAFCKYRIVKELSVGRGYELSTREDEEWDLLWHDGGLRPEVMMRMKPYQRANHYPGMGAISRKNNLGRNLTKMVR